MNDPYYQNPSHFIPNPTVPYHQDQDQDQTQDQDHDQDLRDQRDRVAQWTEPETKELISIRGELDRSFVETKRNKPLWDAISSRMQLSGFIRTPEQCKSKWKNLVTRYKGSEATEGGQKFIFHEEMRAIFLKRMEKVEKVDEEENEKLKKKKKKMKMKRKGEGMEVVEALREFMRRYVEMERRRMEAAEERELERRRKDEEWRRVMVSLQEERMEMDRRWREREEERRVREEAREERRQEPHCRHSCQYIRQMKLLD